MSVRARITGRGKPGSLDRARACKCRLPLTLLGDHRRRGEPPRSLSGSTDRSEGKSGWSQIFRSFEANSETIKRKRAGNLARSGFSAVDQRLIRQAPRSLSGLTDRSEGKSGWSQIFRSFEANSGPIERKRAKNLAQSGFSAVDQRLIRQAPSAPESRSRPCRRQCIPKSTRARSFSARGVWPAWRRCARP